MNNITCLTHLILMNNINRNLRKSKKNNYRECSRVQNLGASGFQWKDYTGKTGMQNVSF